MINRAVVEIVTEWDIVAARQLGRNEAKELGFGTVDQARITTAISELSRNIYLYALAGEIVIERVTDGDRFGIRVMAVDKGQSVVDVRNVTEDGLSASGIRGVGLSGVKRLMDNFEIKYDEERGTIIKVEKWLKDVKVNE